MAEDAGARELTGVDNDASPGLINFLIPFRRSRIKVFEANLYDLRPKTIGTFEIVICAGVLYHLRYPIWGMKRLVDLLDIGGSIVLETAVLEMFGDFPVLFYPFGEASPFEASSPSFVNLPGVKNFCSMLGLEQFRVLERFASAEYDSAKNFPEFARRFPDARQMTITRMVISAIKSRSDSSLEKYFEGIHRYHSSGGRAF